MPWWRSSAMGRSRSARFKEFFRHRIDAPIKLHGSDSPSSSSSSSSLPASQFCCSFLFWVLGFALVALSGYRLHDAPLLSIRSMWIQQLFSEYNPPGPVHVHLIRERTRSLAENTSEPSTLWDAPNSNGWEPCIAKTENKVSVHGRESRFLQVFCTGGLFQLHICVCNAVTVAWLLNASLVVPYFQESSVWKDPSAFHDIYDIDHFISSLKKEVDIVRQLPPKYSWSTPMYYTRKCLERPNCVFFVPKHASKEWYFENVLPVLESYGVVVLDRFHHRLAFEGLPDDATRLRCRTNFFALRFVRPILEFGHRLVNRMRQKARLVQKQLLEMHSTYPTTGKHGSANRTKAIENKEHGHFVGLHLRFEKDMIAHSACYYGGGHAEQRALMSYRRKTFKNVVPKARFSPEFLRKNGSCPLTPEEVGLLLSGLGFKNSTSIYLAGKGSYGGNARVRPLQDMFPYRENKFSLSSREELQHFLPYSHKLAALDFIVLLGSDVFISNSAGNFPNVLSGHRTFTGPRKSIHPDKAALFTHFSNMSMSWKDFSSAVKSLHKDRLGAPYPRRERYSVFRYPAPDCMCQKMP